MSCMVFRKINILLPTFRRSTTRLPRFVDSFTRLAFDMKNVCFTFCVNKEDFATKEYLENRCKDYQYHICYENLTTPNLSAFFNQAYTETPFKEPDTLIGYFGDDFEARTPNWDIMVLEAMNRYGPTACIYGDCVIGWADRLCTFFVTSRQLVDATEAPFCNIEFPCDFTDKVWFETFKSIKRLFYLTQWKCYHNHST